MLKTIIESSENFCIHQIREEYTINNEISDTKAYISYIDIKTTTLQKYRIYIACSQTFIQKIAKIFIEEEESDEETLIDMILETANFIVGNAKVLAETSNNPYTIMTPRFEKIGFFDFDHDQLKLISIENSKLTIAIKELNG